jgi:hypothetical protein
METGPFLMSNRCKFWCGRWGAFLAPIDKAKSAIRIYRQALAAGSAVAAGDIANAAAAVVGALAAVGITVGGGS